MPTGEEAAAILESLSRAGLLELVPGLPPESPSSYVLSLPLHEITLYRLLAALDSPVHVIPDGEEERRIYDLLGESRAAFRLGVLNRALHVLLEDIRLSDF